MEQILVFDFDGTCFDTFKQSPNGIGVREAVQQSVLDILGPKALPIYEKIGGLQNRAPYELISLLLSTGNENLTSTALGYYHLYHKKLEGFVPPGKGARLAWEEPFASVIAELFVRRKLQILAEEVSACWPRPTKNFPIFWQRLHDSGAFAGILSSGHDLFIERAFELSGMPKPHFMVTDDDMRHHAQNGLPAVHKPDPRLMDEMRELFELVTNIREYKIIYFGDDPAKDGGLAKNAGVEFRLFGQKSGEFQSFDDWLSQMALFEAARTL